VARFKILTSLFKQFNICNLYLALWALYALHWTNANIPVIEKISNIILGINMAISCYYAGIAICKYRLPKLFKAITLLLGIFTIYGLYYLFFGQTHYLLGTPIKKGTYILSVLRSFLPIFTFYVFTIKGYLTPKLMKFWTIVFLCVFITIYFRSTFLHSLISTKDEFVNNTGYLFVLIIPCVYYWKKSSIIQFALIGICFVFIILALKRGAMISAVCVILMFITYKFKTAKSVRKIAMSMLIIAASVLAYDFVSERMTESSLLNTRISQTLQGNMSKRDIIASSLIDYYVNDASVVEQVVGSGADSTLSISFNWAHNDWIEILICQGIIGVLMYLYFWTIFYKQWRSTKEPQSRMIIGSYFVIYIIRTLVSMSYSMIFTIAALGIGYALAANQIYLIRNIRDK